jgi:hypothetical protein
MSKLAPPFFTLQFTDDDGTPLDSGLLYTYETGTTTPEATYVDQAGAEQNENPIELDAAGRCSMWLTPSQEYTFVLKREDGTTVKTWNDIAGVPSGSVAVTSVNTLTGDVVLTADDIAFTTATSTVWFEGTDVTAALDSIIEKVDDLSAGSTTASDVAIVDSGALFTATNVETALAETATALNTAEADIAALEANAALVAFSASNDGNITASVAAGQQTYGTRTATATGGTAPYTYFWVVSTYGQGADTYPPMQITGGSATSAAVTIGGYGSSETNTGVVQCFVTDNTGRVTTTRFTVEATHSA